MTAIERPTPDRGSYQLCWGWFWNPLVSKPASRYSLCNWCNPMNLFFPCTFLTLSCQQFFYPYKNIKEGCSGLGGNKAASSFLFQLVNSAKNKKAVFIWDVFSLPWKRKAARKAVKNSLPFPFLPVVWTAADPAAVRMHTRSLALLPYTVTSL